MNLWIKNTSGQSSASLTFATIGFFVVTLWLLLSIVAKVGHVDIRQFDSAAAMGYLSPLLLLYFGRRHSDNMLSANASTASPLPPPSNPS
jgi:hypothetical protein